MSETKQPRSCFSVELVTEYQAYTAGESFYVKFS